MQITKIISSHSSLNEAIESIGGLDCDELNRAFNPADFDAAAKRLQDSKNPCHVIEHWHRNIIVYEHSADIRLLNAFSPFSSGISSGYQVGLLQIDEQQIVNCASFGDDSRKLIEKMQKECPNIWVLNF
tara:strand:- start:1577 stop:1963 length:387 start_codon:yes stop_codon:yes gene_type:complete